MTIDELILELETIRAFAPMGGASPVRLMDYEEIHGVTVYDTEIVLWAPRDLQTARETPTRVHRAVAIDTSRVWGEDRRTRAEAWQEQITDDRAERREVQA